jgi:DNA polymerase-1
MDEPFVGQAGQFLNKCLTAIGVSRSECYITNACLCRPQGNRTPTNAEIDACNERLEQEIRQIHPQLIVAMGNSAIRAVLGPGTDTVTKIRGYRYWSERFQCYVLPTMHPAGVLRQPRTFDDFARDLQKIRNSEEMTLTMPGGLSQEPPPYEVIETVGRAVKFCSFLQTQEYVACDIETDGFDYRHDPVLSVGFCWAPDSVAILPREVLAHSIVRQNLACAFETPTLHLIFHNGKFDAKFIENRLGVPTTVSEDTLLMHYSVDEREGTHGLKSLAREYCDAPDWEADIKQYLPNSKTPYSAIPRDILFRYQSFDCKYTRQLFFMLKREMESEGTSQSYRNLLIPATNAFVAIEQHGTLIDRTYLESLKETMKPQLDTLQQEMESLAVELGFDLTTVPGGHLNPNSPKQLQVIMYDLLRCPPFEGSKTTSIAALEANQHRHPFLRKLMEHRQIVKLYTTYVIGFLERLGPDDRVRTDYLLFGTVTGRLSSRDPNLQNIPRDSPIKRMFIAPPGHTLVEFDYSALELRVAAHYSGDEALIRAFASGVDIHRQIASKVFRKTPEEITDEERTISKFTSFGILYGRGAYSLATGELNCSLHEAEKFITDFFHTYPGLHQWILATQHQALHDGFLQTPLGRKRRFSFLTSENRGDIERQAVNTPIQSLASDICLNALINIHKALRERDWGWVLFTVHDSVMCEIKDEHLEEAIELIRELAETIPFESGIHFVADFKVGQNWGELQKLGKH